MSFTRTDLRIDPLRIVSGWIRPFSLLEKQDAFINDIGPAAVEETCKGLVQSEWIASDGVARSAKQSETAVDQLEKSYCPECLIANDISGALDGLLVRLKESAELDKLQDLTWFGINLQLTVDTSPGVSNASKALHVLGKRGLAFTVGQRGVLSQYKAFEVLQGLLDSEDRDIYVAMTSADRWWGIYESSHQPGFPLKDSAALGIYRVGQNESPNFVALSETWAFTDRLMSCRTTWEDSPLCLSLLDWLQQHTNQVTPVYYVASPTCSDIWISLMQALRRRCNRNWVPVRCLFGHAGSSHWQMGLELALHEAFLSEKNPFVVLQMDAEPGLGLAVSALMSGSMCQ